MSLVAFNTFAELHINKKKDKIGYVDDNGAVVIKHQFAQATPFENGRAKVQKGKKWGYIDETGRQVIKIDFDEIGEFNEKGIARVKKGGKYGYMRTDGTFLIKPEWTFIGSINEDGYVWVSKAKSLDMGAIGLFKDDKLIVSPNNRYIGFYQTTDSADYADGHVFVTADANEITENFSKLSTSKVPYIWFDRNFQRGVMDLDGKIVVKAMSYAQGAPVEDRVLCRQYNKKKDTYSYNYVPAVVNGKKIFKKDITVGTDNSEGCYPFNDGAALVVSKKEGCYLVDKTGAKLSKEYQGATAIGNSMFIVNSNSLFGLLNTAGQEVVGCTYGNLVAPLKNGNLLAAKNASDGKCGIIDLKGETVLPFVYDDVLGSLHGRAYVRQRDGWGVVDMAQKQIVAPRWDAILYAENPQDNYLWVKEKNGGKWRCLDIAKDDFANNLAFDGATAFSSEGTSVVMDGDHFGVVRDNGEFVIPVRLSNVALAPKALASVKENGKNSMSDTEAYKFNIYNNPDRHKLMLSQPVADEMWDF